MELSEVTLAQAKLTEVQIKANTAVKEYQQALSGTVSNDDAKAVQQQIKQQVKRALKQLSNRWAQAIEGEHDETQVHYLLSDAAIDWQNELAHGVKESVQQDGFGKVYAKAVKPKELLTVSQCAVKYRYLETGTNMPGKWRNENAPHIVEIMDALSLHSTTKRVTLKKSSGISGTEIWLNWLLYIIKHAVKDVMLVVPDQKGLQKTFIPRIRKMFKESPCLKELYDQRNHRDKDTEEVIEIGNVKITMAMASAVNSFRAEHVPYTITDEKSAMPLKIGDEGDVGMLTDNRTKTYTRRKKFDVSSPTVEDFCQISDDYEDGSQEQRYIYCPHCNHAHTFVFKNFRWLKSPEDDKKVLDVWFICPSCNGRIEERQKNALLDKAVWIAKYPKRKKEHRSFLINSFYIKYGLGLTWIEIAELWLNCIGDSSKIITFINTYLAEASSIEGEGIEANALLSRLETFPEQMPDVMRFFGADVQGNRLEATIVDIDENKEFWVQEQLIVLGDPTAADGQVWLDFERALKERNVDFGTIDTGWQSKIVKNFCSTRRWFHPIKGDAGMSKPFIEDEAVRARKFRTRAKYGVKSEMLGVDSGKIMIYNRLKLDSKTTFDVDTNTGEILKVIREPNPGYIHFRNADCFDAKYFEQLAGEELRTTRRKGKKILYWHQVKTRNEALDCMVYATAAYEIAKDMKKLKFTSKPNIEELGQVQNSRSKKIIKKKKNKMASMFGP